MSAATPVPMTASCSPFLHVVTDPWILISWQLFIGTGTDLCSDAVATSHAPWAYNIIASFLFTGYILWSAYFGLAACWRLCDQPAKGNCIDAVRRRLPLDNGWMLFVLALVYAWLGGGIYHFGRRWWLLVHGQHPPTLIAQRQVLYR